MEDEKKLAESDAKDQKTEVKAEEKPENETKKESKKESKPKKKKKVLKRIFGFIGILFLIGVLYAGWLGFVPGLSSLLGAHTPRDLGVTYTEKDLASFYEKTGQKELDFANAPVKPGDPLHKVIFADPAIFDMRLTQEEITARINELDWAYKPVKNVQVRFGDNNQIEVSGNIDIDGLEKFIPFIGGVGYSQDDVNTGLEWLRRMSGSPAFYIDSVGSIKDNVLSLEIKSAQVGRWNAPIGSANDVLNTATGKSIKNTDGLDVKSATFDDGGFNFIGSGPTTIYVKR